MNELMKAIRERVEKAEAHEVDALVLQSVASECYMQALQYKGVDLGTTGAWLDALAEALVVERTRVESLEAALREIAGDAGPCFFNGCEAPRCVASRALSATEETQGTP